MKNTELYNVALEALRNDDDLFVDMVTAVDQWDGYADGFRAFPMYELDDLFCGCKVSEFLDKITDSFSLQDEYIVDTIYGLESTSDIVTLYRDNICEDDLLDHIIDNFGHLDFWDHGDFEEMIEQLA